MVKKPRKALTLSPARYGFFSEPYLAAYGIRADFDRFANDL
jgi:hypothetical protein